MEPVTMAEEFQKELLLLQASQLMQDIIADWPDIVIDDMPSTCVSPFVYSVQEEAAWPKLAERIIQKHVD